MPTFSAAMLRILDENGISYGTDIINIITPLGMAGCAAYFIGLGVKKTVAELLADMENYMAQAYFHRIPAKKNVIETLRTLKEQGADLNVLTASPHVTLDACLKRLGIYDLFTNVWSCNDFHTTKSDPDIYKRVAACLGRPVEQILFLDDNLEADTTAKTAGMKVCGVFDPSSAQHAERIKAVADYYIEDFEQLLQLQF